MAFPELTGRNTDEIQLPCLCCKTREPGMTNIPYRDGATHVMLEPMDFIARLVVLVHRPRVNMTRYHGLLSPIVFFIRDAAD